MEGNDEFVLLLHESSSCISIGFKKGWVFCSQSEKITETLLENMNNLVWQGERGRG